MAVLDKYGVFPQQESSVLRRASTPLKQSKIDFDNQIWRLYVNKNLRFICTFRTWKLPDHFILWLSVYLKSSHNFIDLKRLCKQ